MAKHVLDIGNCGPDHASITRMIETSFDANVDQAHTLDDALPQLESQTYDLVMVNRLLDIDGSSGLDVLKAIQKQFKVPTMLITNFAEHQQAAIEVGAVQGFGKNSINSAETFRILEPHLR